MRELLTKARERFGPDAARYKTRQELLAALGLIPVDSEPSVQPSAPVEQTPAQPLVVRDFFLPPSRR